MHSLASSNGCRWIRFLTIGQHFFTAHGTNPVLCAQPFSKPISNKHSQEYTSSTRKSFFGQFIFKRWIRLWLERVAVYELIQTKYLRYTNRVLQMSFTDCLEISFPRTTILVNYIFFVGPTAMKWWSAQQKNLDLAKRYKRCFGEISCLSKIIQVF